MALLPFLWEHLCWAIQVFLPLCTYLQVAAKEPPMHTWDYK